VTKRRVRSGAPLICRSKKKKIALCAHRPPRAAPAGRKNFLDTLHAATFFPDVCRRFKNLFKLAARSIKRGEIRREQGKVSVGGWLVICRKITAPPECGWRAKKNFISGATSSLGSIMKK